jgi:prepilin-type processing-associated H-X9-DG protein
MQSKTIISYASIPSGNRPATIALVWGLLNFVPFLSGAMAIKYGKAGLRLAASSGAGGAKARAGLVLGIVNLIWSVIFAISLYPAYQRARRASEAVQCAAQLRQIGAACMIYAASNRGYMPPSLATLTSTMVLPTMLTCPAATRAGAPTPYIYVLPSAKVSTIRNPSRTVLVYESPTNHGGGWMNVLFADGHVAMLKPAGFAALMPPSVPSTLPLGNPSR